MASLTAFFGRMSLTASSFHGDALQQRRMQAPASARLSAPLTIEAKRRWERTPMNEKTGKPIMVKTYLKKGDKVKVISGGDKGKVSEVVKVDRKTGRVIVKDVNVATKHVKPKAEGETGQITKMEMGIHHSNVALVTEDGRPSRVAYKMVDGKKKRVLVKTGSAA